MLVSEGDVAQNTHRHGLNTSMSCYSCQSQILTAAYIAVQEYTSVDETVLHVQPSGPMESNSQDHTGPPKMTGRYSHYTDWEM